MIQAHGCEYRRLPATQFAAQYFTQRGLSGTSPRLHPQLPNRDQTIPVGGLVEAEVQSFSNRNALRSSRPNSEPVPGPGRTLAPFGQHGLPSGGIDGHGTEDLRVAFNRLAPELVPGMASTASFKECPQRTFGSEGCPSVRLESRNAGVAARKANDGRTENQCCLSQRSASPCVSQGRPPLRGRRGRWRVLRRLPPHVPTVTSRTVNRTPTTVLLRRANSVSTF